MPRQNASRSRGSGRIQRKEEKSGGPLLLPVLVLNRLFQPLRITSCRRAVRMICVGSARILNRDGELLGFDAWCEQPVRPGLDDGLETVSGVLRVPRVIHLVSYARLRGPSVRLCRRTLLVRDSYRCQYCGYQGGQASLDVDHVLPRSRGGEASWENLVIACMACNRKKGRQTPAEAGMPLLRRPRRPGWGVSVKLAAGPSEGYEEWQPFLQAM